MFGDSDGEYLICYLWQWGVAIYQHSGYLPQYRHLPL